MATARSLPGTSGCGTGTVPMGWGNGSGCSAQYQDPETITGPALAGDLVSCHATASTSRAEPRARSRPARLPPARAGGLDVGVQFVQSPGHADEQLVGHRRRFGHQAVELPPGQDDGHQGCEGLNGGVSAGVVEEGTRAE